MDAFCVLQPGTKMDKGEEGRKGYGINRMIETVKFSPKLLSRVFERVRSLGERSLLGPWIEWDRAWVVEFRSLDRVQRGNGAGINGV